MVHVNKIDLLVALKIRLCLSTFHGKITLLLEQLFPYNLDWLPILLDYLDKVEPASSSLRKLKNLLGQLVMLGSTVRLNTTRQNA